MKHQEKLKLEMCLSIAARRTILGNQISMQSLESGGPKGEVKFENLGKAVNEERLKIEYKDIPPPSLNWKTEIATLPFNRPKNRYLSLLTYSTC